MLFSGNKTAFVHAYMIRNINGVLHNGKQSSSVVTIFTEQGKVEAVKSLSGYDAMRWDEHQFCSKRMTSTSVVFELSFFDKVIWTKKEMVL